MVSISSFDISACFVSVVIIFSFGLFGGFLPEPPNRSLKGTRGYVLVFSPGIRPPEPLSLALGLKKWEIVMIVIGMTHKHKAILVGIVLIVGICFGFSNHAYALTYGEVNAQRAQVGLPLLTGNRQLDFQILVNECNGGIRYSCTLAQQIQIPPQPLTFDLNDPLKGMGIPEAPPVSARPPSGGVDQACVARAQKMIDDAIARGGAGVAGISMMNSCYH